MQYFQFQSPTVLKVSGKDALRYLNARLSNDVSQIESNAFIDAATLSAQGKTEAFFTVCKEEDAYLLYSSGGDSAEITTAFKRFLVADQVVVEALENISLFHILASAQEVEELFPGCSFQTSKKFQKISSYTLLAKNRLGEIGIDIFCPTEQIKDLRERLNSSGALLSSDEYNYLRVVAGIPDFPHELNEDILFAESQLKEAVSFSKGCYVGQEAIEMLAARGKLPAALKPLLADGKTELVYKQAIYNSPEKEKRIGAVVSHFYSLTENKTALFARIKIDCLELKKFYLENGTVLSPAPESLA